MTRVVPSQIVTLITLLLPKTETVRIAVSHSTAAGLTAIARLIDELPSELLSVSGDSYSDLVRGVEAIRNAVTFWQHKGIGEIQILGIDDRNVLKVLKDVLQKCPDQIPSPKTVELNFITDITLRDSIRLDVSAANNALHNGEWKASTVLAGSAAEALLLWAITDAPALETLENKPKKPLDRWDLSEYIETAKSLGLIDDKTQQLTNLAKDFRNLIHPGRARRLAQICDRATALTALAAVERIVRDLLRRSEE